MEPDGGAKFGSQNGAIPRIAPFWFVLGTKFGSSMTQNHEKNHLCFQNHKKQKVWALQFSIMMSWAEYRRKKSCYDQWKKLHKKVDTFFRGSITVRHA